MSQEDVLMGNPQPPEEVHIEVPSKGKHPKTPKMLMRGGLKALKKKFEEFENSGITNKVIKETEVFFKNIQNTANQGAENFRTVANQGIRGIQEGANRSSENLAQIGNIIATRINPVKRAADPTPIEAQEEEEEEEDSQGDEVVDEDLTEALRDLEERGVPLDDPLGDNLGPEEVLGDGAPTIEIVKPEEDTMGNTPLESHSEDFKRQTKDLNDFLEDHPLLGDNPPGSEDITNLKQIRLNKRFIIAASKAYKKLLNASKQRRASDQLKHFVRSLKGLQNIIRVGADALNAILQGEVPTQLDRIYCLLHVAYAVSQTKDLENDIPEVTFRSDLDMFRKCLSSEPEAPNKPSEQDLFDELIGIMLDEFKNGLLWVHNHHGNLFGAGGILESELENKPKTFDNMIDAIKSAARVPEQDCLPSVAPPLPIVRLSNPGLALTYDEFPTLTELIGTHIVQAVLRFICKMSSFQLLFLYLGRNVVASLLCHWQTRSSYEALHLSTRMWVCGYPYSSGFYTDAWFNPTKSAMRNQLWERFTEFCETLIRYAHTRLSEVLSGECELCANSGGQIIACQPSCLPATQSRSRSSSRASTPLPISGDVDICDYTVESPAISPLEHIADSSTVGLSATSPPAAISLPASPPPASSPPTNPIPTIPPTTNLQVLSLSTTGPHTSHIAGRPNANPSFARPPIASPLISSLSSASSPATTEASFVLSPPELQLSPATSGAPSPLPPQQAASGKRKSPEYDTEDQDFSCLEDMWRTISPSSDSSVQPKRSYKANRKRRDGPEGPYKCPELECKSLKGYMNKQSLKRHCNDNHSNTVYPVLECKLCGTPLGTSRGRDNMIQHILEDHKEWHSKLKKKK
ncbi:hypothetical protein ABW19_dt0207736 [Dactylella cylindrospora]|nr:hypothetical protein ABW19_dt0207736 [Dactylella cylindrospora]